MRNDEKEKKFNEYELDLKEKIKKALKKWKF